MKRMTALILAVIMMFALICVFSSCDMLNFQGEKGEKGEQGTSGKDGVSIAKTEINDKGELIITFSDGTVNNLGVIVGANGAQGSQGEKGDQGEPGDQGPQGEPGQAGTTPYIAINEDGYWVINGEVTSYLAEGDNLAIIEALSPMFEYRQDQFVCVSETLPNPSWNYGTSTFSGWGGSIGKPDFVDAIAIRVRARDVAITQIKFHLNYNDKMGESIASEIIDVYIPPYAEAEIVWDVPVKLQNNQSSLYFCYNCNQLCDVYSNFGAPSYIPEEEYQAILTYTTNGSLLSSASKMTDDSKSTARYLYVKLGKLQDLFVMTETFENEIVESLKEKVNTINVFLPKEYDITINDNFQLFYRGVVQVVNPANYDIRITCSKGKSFPRYFEWKPTEEDIGSYTLTLDVFDDNGVLLGTDSTVLNVHKPKTENAVQNVLCIGASTTGGGQWVAEAARRFTGTGGKIAGLGLDYLNFVGTVEKTIGDTTVRFEGYGGWIWSTYCSANSPFYDAELGDISFKSYCERNGIEDIDVVYFLLGWNNQGQAYKTDFSVDSGHFLYARKLIDKLHEEYPNAVVRCMSEPMPSQNGGMGANYGATGAYSNDYGMLITGMHYYATLEQMCLLPEYADFVKYVDVAGQFDTDYNMPSTQKPVNNRNDTTEVMGTNGLHPTLSGYYQVADAVFRSLCEIYSEEK